MTDRYAVIGNPIAHSKSPAIHAAFAAQTAQDLSYEALLAPLDGFADAVAAFRASGGRGMNITVPFKEEAWRLADRLTERARLAGAVNTFVFGDDVLGDNTDGAGLVGDLETLGCRLPGTRVLLLGAGGAIAGIAPALLDAGAGDLVIANRHPERAEALALRIGEPARVTSAYWQDLSEAGEFDLVVNGTSAGHRGEEIALPMRLLAPRALAYDLNYGPAATGFLAWARAAGALDCHDGLGMLVDQAAVAFGQWNGVEPDADAVLAELRGGQQAP